MFLTRIIVSQQLCRSFTRSLYIQGQSPEAKVREYFYFIDHQGMVGLILAFRIVYRDAVKFSIPGGQAVMWWA